MFIASIDIGTNTVLMIIAESDKRTKTFSVLENIYRIPRLGRGLSPGSPIPEENLKKFYEVLTEYKKIIDRYKCSIILTAATMAFRQASNSSEIIGYVKNNFGIDINIISGEEEAELSYLGAVSGYNSVSDNVVIDIGGGSTEIIFGRGKEIIYHKSFHIGVVSSSERFNQNGVLNIPLLNEKLEQVFDLPDQFRERAPVKAIAVAGTPTTLACIKKGISEFNENAVEGTILTQKDVSTLAVKLQLPPEEILNSYGQVVKGREDLILSGTCILLYLMKLMHITEVLVSTKGIRYGLVYRFLQDQ